MRRDLPARVYLKHGAFYYVDFNRKWIRLCAEKDGLPGVYRAMARLKEAEVIKDRMPAVLTAWLDEARGGWAASTTRNRERQIRELSRKLAEFRPSEVTAKDVAVVLESYRDRPRTHNQYRDVLRQALAWAARKGLREGHNPVNDVKGKATPGRKRHVTDDEIAKLKEHATHRDGKLIRNGRALCLMIDLALLTGQRISDVIGWRWQDVADDGLHVLQGKGKKRLVIELTPALRAVLAECAKGRDKIGHILKTQSGSGYKYAGIRSAWVRACDRASVDDLNIHDLRGRAGVDKQQAEGMEAAKDLLGHDRMSTTEHYVHGKVTKRVRPTR